RWEIPMLHGTWLRVPSRLFRMTILKAKRGAGRPQRRRADRPSLESLETRWLPSTVNWINNSSGDWDTPANWSTGTLPTPADDVVINKAGVTVSHGFSNFDSVHSLTSQNAIVLSGGTLVLGAASTINNTFTLSGGTLTGLGKLTVSGQLSWMGGTMSG